MDFVIVLGIGFAVIVVLSMLEGRKDRRRRAMGLRYRTTAPHNWIDISDGVRLEQPVHTDISHHKHDHSQHNNVTDTSSTHMHHHGHDAGHHGGGFDAGGGHSGGGHH